VPWHDNGWQGTFCNHPCGNTSCTVLPRIASGRDDEFETKHAGESIEGLDREQLPPCADEHATIMAAFSQSMLKSHPYAESAKETHSHFAPTPYTIRPYSAVVLQFATLNEVLDGFHTFFAAHPRLMRIPTISGTGP
jgi:hypothetical protein